MSLFILFHSCVSLFLVFPLCPGRVAAPSHLPPTQVVYPPSKLPNICRVPILAQVVIPTLEVTKVSLLIVFPPCPGEVSKLPADLSGVDADIIFSLF